MNGHLMYSFQATLIATLLLFLAIFLTVLCLRCRDRLQLAHPRGWARREATVNRREHDSEECELLIRNDNTSTDSLSSQEDNEDKHDEAAIFIPFDQENELEVPQPGIKPGKPWVALSSGVSFNSIELEWERPEQHAHNVTSYIVYGSTSNNPYQWIKQKANQMTVDNSVPEKILVTNLLEKTTYYFKIRLEYEAGNALDSEISDPIRTKGIIPSQPGKPVGSSLSHDSIQLEWTKPKQGAHNVIAYHIFYHSNKDPPDQWIELKSEGTKENVTVSQLLERTIYSFKIWPESADGYGPESEVSEQICTKVMIPSKPGKPIASKVTHNSIDLEWTKPEQGAHNIMSYTVFYRSTSDSPDTWREQKTKAAEERATITQLCEMGAYLFKVRPEREGMDTGGSMSDASELIQTKMIIPTRPGKPSASNITHDSIQLEWTKPEQGVHSIITYRVFYRSRNEPPDKFSEHKTEIVEEKVTISQLLEETVYFFKVQPECHSGFGLESEVSEPIATKVAIPSKPGKPIASDITHDSVQIKWTKPEQGAHNISFYKIFYRSTNDPPDVWSEQLTSTAEESATISPLVERSTYLFKVSSEPKSGEPGLESGESEPIQTAMIIPSKPGRPTAVNVTHDSIKVEWTEPEQGAHNVAFYTVFYRSTSDPPDTWSKQKTKAAEIRATVTDLLEKSTYLFKIMPESVSGESGSESDMSEPIKTRESLTFKNIFRKLRGIGGKWFILGVYLDLGYYELCNIKHKNNDEWEPCLMDMIHLWLTQKKERSWETLINALKEESVGLYYQATSISESMSNDSESKEFQDAMPSGEGFECPYCRECSINRYMKRECPKFRSSDLAFPYLVRTKNLTTNEREIVESQLLKQTREVITEFSEFIRDIRDSFQRIDPVKLAAAVIDIAPRESLTRSLLGSLDVENVNSVVVMISNLQQQNYISFFNYHILQDLVKKYGTKEDKTKLSAYDKKFKDFCKRSVFEIPEGVLGPPPNNGQKLAFKVTKLLTLDEAQSAKRKIAEILDIEENIGGLIFLGANKGCVELNFSAPKALLDRLQKQQNAKTLTELPGFAALESEGITILCGPPGKPYVIAVTSKAINLQWSRPEYKGSHPIQCYYVHYKSLYDSSAKWRVVQSEDSKETLEIRLFQKFNNMPFIFKVQAVNAVGAGVLSETSDPIILAQQSQLMAKDFPSKPGKPKALIINHNSIQIGWTKPEKGAERITSYTISYHAQFYDPPNQWRELRTASAEEKVIISHLFDSTTYLFQALPECEDGVGLASDISDPITTKMIMPSKPGKPQVIVAARDSVILEWTKPEEGAHNILSYLILYQSTTDPTDEWIAWKSESADERATVTQLSKETEYYFKVKPECEEGFGIESDISELVCIKTSAESLQGEWVEALHIMTLIYFQSCSAMYLPSTCSAMSMHDTLMIK